ncbi:MAG: ferredoxin--NADP reductase [Burkholderiales bacterium]|nr:ferredoxin--NADP reductase [Burkholderiales bacterium]
MATTKWIEGTVVGQTRWTDQIFSLRVQADVGAFEAGQHATLALPVDGELVTRPYSFVNAPKERPCEFHYMVVPEGPFTARLARLEPRDVVFLAPAPSGLFVLSAVPDAETLWLLATGTGVGPYLSMLKTEAPWRRFGQVVLVHSVRHAAELTYRDAIAALAREHAGRLGVVTLTSREKAAGALAGRIAETIEDRRLEKAAGRELSPAASQVMICGSPKAIADITEALRPRGMRRHRRREPGHISVENYW